MLESVKVTVYALRYCTPFGSTRRLTNYPLRGADHPSDIGQESGCDHGFVVELVLCCVAVFVIRYLNLTPFAKIVLAVEW